MGEGDKQTNKHTDRHTDTHINAMTRPGLGAGPSENEYMNILGKTLAIRKKYIMISILILESAGMGWKRQEYAEILLNMIE